MQKQTIRESKKTQKIKSPHVFVIRIFVGLFFLALGYVVVSGYFTEHFFINSSINGISIGLCTKDSAKDRIQRLIDDYELTITDEDDEDYITGQEAL